MNTLEKKRVVVTGAASGIGREVTLALLDKGAVVYAAIRPGEVLDISNANLYHGSHDISDSKQIDELFHDALDCMGTIDIFVSNAGFAYYEVLPKADWNHIESIFQTNVFPTIYAAQKMKDLHEGQPFQFITTASAMAYFALPGYSLYSSTKAAIRSFSESYRYELNDEQTFQVVYPISTRTSFFHNAGDSPVPWPSQSAQKVAREIIKGITKRRNRIFPSKLFLGILIMDRVFPWISTLYQHHEFKKLKLLIEETIK